MSETNNSAAAASSTITGSVPAPKKNRWDYKGKKNLLIAICIIGGTLLLSLILLFGRNKEVAKQSSLPTEVTMNKGGARSIEQDAAQQQLERMRVEALAATGKSAVETPVVPNPLEDTGPKTGTKITTINPSEISPGQLPNAAPPQPQQPQQPAGPSAQEQQLMTAMKSQLDMQMKAWGMTPDSPKAVMLYERQINNSNSKSANGGAGGTAGNVSNTAASNEARRGAVVVPAFEATYTGQSINTHDSDFPDSVRTKILTGPLAGAVLYGPAKMRGKGTSIDYTDASFNGRKFKVNAMSVDEQTASDIVDGTYNGRYATRFALPVIMEGIKAFTAARAQTGSQITIFGAGAAQAQPAPTTDQARNAMISAGTNRADRALSQLPQTGQAILERNQTYGIVFLDPVFEGDLTGQTQGSSAPTTPAAARNAQGAQQGYQSNPVYQGPGYATPGTMPLPGQVNNSGYQGYQTAPATMYPPQYQQPYPYQQQYAQPYPQ